MTVRALAAMVCLSALLCACGGTRTLGSLDKNAQVDGPPPAHKTPKDLASIPDAVPKIEPLSRYGNPDSYQVLGKTYHVLESSTGYKARGIASWYGRKFHGRTTSSGEPYDMFLMTAAHRTLPLPSYVRVTNLNNGRHVVVRVNDRGPFHSDRILDLSYAAAVRLDMIGNGTAPVEVVALKAGAQPGNEASDPALYLQAGAYAQPTNARKMALHLEALGQQRVFITPTASDKPLYRVRIGPYPDRDKLQAARADLQSHGIKVSAERE